MNRVDTDRLRADLHHVVEDVERVLQSTANLTDRQITELRERADRGLHAARERLAGLEAEAATRGRVVVHRSRTYAQDNPWTVAGIAAAAAFLIGWLGRRR